MMDLKRFAKTILDEIHLCSERLEKTCPARDKCKVSVADKLDDEPPALGEILDDMVECHSEMRLCFEGSDPCRAFFLLDFAIPLAKKRSR